MTEFLLNHFTKKVTGVSKRDRYGSVAGIIGIISNVVISAMKLTLGLVLSNIAIIADGINNLSDAAGSVITVVGFKVSSKPADKEHPFGHARMEYVSALGVSFIVLFLGLQLLIESVTDILNPEPTEFGVITVIVLVFSIAVKIWQRFFFKKVSVLIDSKLFFAASVDSRNDILISLAVLLSLPLSNIAGFSLSGYAGAIVSLFILYSGMSLIKETVTPLLGAPADMKLINDITQAIRSGDGVLGIHDLVVHNYGVGKYFASVHVEMSADNDLLASHEAIDDIEQNVRNRFGVALVIHLDPVVKDDRVTELKDEVQRSLQEISDQLKIHDFRAVFRPNKVKLIFDVEAPYSFLMDDEELKNLIVERIASSIPNSVVVVFLDRYYI